MSAHLQRSEIGTVGSAPGTLLLHTTDTFSTITSAGYIQKVGQASGAYPKPTDFVFVNYSGGSGLFTISNSNGVFTLVQDGSPVTTPTTANHIATYTNTSGSLSEDANPAINGGSIQAGLSGTAGSLISYPATASKGSLALTAVANTGNTATVISNAPMGQASTITIPDPAAATAKFMLDHGTNTMAAGSSIVLAKVNGTESSNAVTASGVAGVITTSALTTAGGSSYAITWTNTAISATSVVLLTIAGGTNTTENVTLKCVAGSGTATLTIYNNTAATALNGTILINYLVM